MGRRKMSSQMTIRIADFESPAPPEKVLRLGYVDGILFAAIEKADEKFSTESYEVESQIAVECGDVINAITTLIGGEVSADIRKKIEEGRRAAYRTDKG